LYYGNKRLFKIDETDPGAVPGASTNNNEGGLVVLLRSEAPLSVIMRRYLKEVSSNADVMIQRDLKSDP